MPDQDTRPATQEADQASAFGDFRSGVGDRLRFLMAHQGRSLERLAAASGLGEASIGKLADGEIAPSLNVLWKIANALGVPVGSLISTRRRRGTFVLRNENKTVISSNDGHFTTRPLFPHDCKRLVEFYELNVAPGHVEHCEAHAPGTLESLVVVRGSVEVTSGKEQAQKLGEGDAIVFEADVPHTYRNLGSAAALLYLVISYVNVADA
jgi:transcriptional regulator with XRE-family HTH domain